MKNLPTHTSILFLLFQILQITSFAQNDSLVGNWSGVFMDQFKMSFTITSVGKGTYAGRLEMFAGNQQIQDDEMTKIAISGNDFTFFLEAKDTRFQGVVDFETKQVNGHFIFPDGSQHQVLVNRDDNVAPKSTVISTDKLSATLPADQMKNDMYFLVDKLNKLHPRLNANTPKPEFERQVEECLNALNNDETVVNYYNQIVSITDAVGCSHTGIRLPREIDEALKSEGKYFPAKIYFQNKKAYYVKGVSEKSKIQVGSEILKINGTDVSKIIDQIFKYIPAEGHNLNTKYNQLNRNFYDYYVLLNNAENFEIEYVTINSIDVNKEVIPASTFTEISELYSKTPNSLSDEFPIHFELKQEMNLGLLTIESFRVRDVNKFIDYMDSVFTLVNAENITNLIIDLRDNSGGHPIFAAQLFSYLMDKPFVYFDTTSGRVPDFAPLYTMLQPNKVHYKGNCFVIVNGGCLSTTGHFISLVKYHKLATFIGEEPGSSFQCNDNSQQYVLPNSGIELNIPTTVFRTAVGDFFKKQPNIVDLPVDVEIKDVISNNDKYLEMAYKQIHKSYTLNE